MGIFNINRQSGKEKKTSLIRSIEKNDAKKFKKLISNPKINIDIVDVNGRTPLMYAFFNGRLEFVNILLQKGASVNTRDVTERSLLDYYAESNNSEVIKYLISIGSEFGGYCSCLNNMSEETLRATFTSYKQSKIIKEIQSQGVGDSVRSHYIKYLKNTKNKKQLKKYFFVLTEYQAELRLLIYESLTDDLIDIKMKNTALRDYLTLKQYSKSANIIRQGARINQKFFETRDIIELLKNKELKEALFSFQTPELIKILTDHKNPVYATTLWNDLATYLISCKDYSALKKFCSALADYEKKDDFYEYHDTKKKNIRKTYREIFSALPSEEKDQYFIQKVFLSLDMTTTKSLISSGFNMNFHHSDGTHILHFLSSDLIVYTLSVVPYDKLVSTYSEDDFMTYFFEDYVRLLKRHNNWKQLEKLYWEKGHNREAKKIIYEVLPGKYKTSKIEEDLKKLFRLSIKDFNNTPGGLYKLNDEQILEVVRYAITKEDPLFELGQLGPAMAEQGVEICYSSGNNCGHCNGTGESINRNEENRPCPVCNGDETLSDLSVIRDNKDLWKP